MNTRRKLLGAMLASFVLALAAPSVQSQPRPRRIGFLWERDPSDYAQLLEGFKAGMRALGYAEGRDYVVEHRAARDDLARLPPLAVELLGVKVDVIIAPTSPAAVAARKASREIPIVVVTVTDPVASGLAATLSRPGGNVTGLTQGVGSALYSKRLDLLRQFLPNIRRVGFLYSPENPADGPGLAQFESDCRSAGLKAIPVPMRNSKEIAAAFDTLQREQAQGLLVSTAGAVIANRDSILAHAAKHRLPVVSQSSLLAELGALLSYGPDLPDLYRRAAAYADKILKGAKPGDLPIEQPNRFEMVINLKTAKALGLTIPHSILVSADKVIE